MVSFNIGAVAITAALIGAVKALPQDYPVSNITSLDKRSDTPDDFVINDKWEQLVCVHDGVARHEFQEADKRFREWMSGRDSMMAPNTRHIFQYGYTQVWVCTWGGRQAAREDEWNVFMKLAGNGCHGHEGYDDNDKGARYTIMKWKKEYGYSSTGFEPCPGAEGAVILHDLTPSGYNENPLKKASKLQI